MMQCIKLPKHSIFWVILLFGLFACQKGSNSTNKGGGEDEGGGMVGNPSGDSSELEDNAHWFPGPRIEKKAKFCIVRSNDFPRTQAELREMIESAFTEWNEKVLGSPLFGDEKSDDHFYTPDVATFGALAKIFSSFDAKNPKGFYLSPYISIEYRANCDAPRRNEYVIPFYFGIKPNGMSETAWRNRLRTNECSTEHGAYDDRRLLMKNGYVWFGPPKPVIFQREKWAYNLTWTEPLILESAVLHEVGHIFGNSHGASTPDEYGDGTVMEAGLVRKLIKAFTGYKAMLPHDYYSESGGAGRPPDYEFLKFDHPGEERNWRPSIDHFRILYQSSRGSRFTQVGTIGDDVDKQIRVQFTGFDMPNYFASIFRDLTGRHALGTVWSQLARQSESLSTVVIHDDKSSTAFEVEGSDDLETKSESGYSFIVNTGDPAPARRFLTKPRFVEIGSNRWIYALDPTTGKRAKEGVPGDIFLNKLQDPKGRHLFSPLIIQAFLNKQSAPTVLFRAQPTVYRPKN